ncbi:MAG: SGNH/GDSL hydrolase family protein, partial [Verrucomicrobia bacterium]|nr:SGNH/GDSL hydrolase family protein [Verrucomicrobiota bacterium]
MKTKLLSLLGSLVFAASAFAQEKKADAPAPPNFKPVVAKMDLKSGDTVVFLGDSITHQCLYTQYVEDYFYTRFPKTRIHFHNSGVGGDRASDALRRFDDDVAGFKPKYVTILLGMNDGGYKGFDQPTFDTYQKGMTELLDKLAGVGATAIPMTPTMHDARAARMGKKGGAEPRDTYYNGVLALYGAWLREQAQVRGLGFVDMYSPLNDLTLAERKKDANFTLIPDAVHPGPNGQVVMALAVIDDICPKGPVSAITLQPGKDWKLVGTAANGKVSDVSNDDKDNKISFTFAANALPWVLPAEAAQGYKLTHAGHRDSNEKITVRNLPPGKYELKIDGQAAGLWTDGQLAFGVELEENEKTPEYQQALAVAALNKEKNDKAMRPLRGLWSQLKGKRSQLGQLQQQIATIAKQQESDNAPELEAKRKELEKSSEA